MSCYYPIHTKLSDLLKSSDDDDQDTRFFQPIPDTIKTRVNVSFTASSSKSIVYRDFLDLDDTDRDSLEENNSSEENKSSEENNSLEKNVNENRVKITHKTIGSSVDENGNRCPNLATSQVEQQENQNCNISQKSDNKPSQDTSPVDQEAANKTCNISSQKSDKPSQDTSPVDQEANNTCNISQKSDNKPCQDSDSPHNSMSKKLGSLFHKSGRSKTTEKAGNGGGADENDAETVLPHLKPGRRPIPEVESSFIDVQEDHYKSPESYANRRAAESGYRRHPAARALASRVSNSIEESPAEASSVVANSENGDTVAVDSVKKDREVTITSANRKLQRMEDTEDQRNSAADADLPSKSSKPNGEITTKTDDHRQTMNGGSPDSSHGKDDDAVSKAMEDDEDVASEMRKQRPGLTRSKSEVSSNATDASERGDSEDDEASDKEQNEQSEYN